MIAILRYYWRILGLRGLLAAIAAKLAGRSVLLQLRRSDVRFPFWLRIPSSDPDAFGQIFIDREYDFEASRSPAVIIDAGANTGLASIRFASRFPQARVIAIEPESGNLQMLRLNTAPYANISVVDAALWSESAVLDVVDPGLGSWGFVTVAHAADTPSAGRVRHSVRGMTVDEIMQAHGIDHVDILKLDVEGAEREIFGNAARWIDKVDAIIIELHEWMKPGCNQSFRGVSSRFDQQWQQGENLYVARSGSCMAVRSSGQK